MLGLAVLCLAPAQARAADRPFLVIMDVVSQRWVGSAPHDDNVMYFGKYFKVRLRPAAVASDGRPVAGEFDAVLESNFDRLPRRIFVLIDSRKSRKVVFWEDVEELFCVDRDDLARVDPEALSLSPLTVGAPGSGPSCFRAEPTGRSGFAEAPLMGFAASVTARGAASPAGFPVELRGDSFTLGEGGKPIELYVTLTPGGEPPAERLFLIVEAARPNRVVLWANIRSFFCLSFDYGDLVDLATLGLTPVDSGISGDSCFTYGAPTA